MNSTELEKHPTKQSREIKIAILAEEPMGWGSGKHYFPVILHDFQWTAGNISYVMKAEYVFDKDIRNGKLHSKNYDVLLVPGGGVGDGHSIMKGFTSFRRVRQWKSRLAEFIKEGGGYVGICGGTALLTGLITSNKSTTTFIERQYQKSSLEVSCVQSYYKHLATPLFYPFQRKLPENIGATGYVFSFAPAETTDGYRFYAGGVPVDFQIFNDHPIFADFPKDIERIRWWGGPALLLPKQPNRKVTILAKYPKKDFSIQPHTKIHAWFYTGGIRGILKGLIKSFYLIKDNNESLRNLLTYAYFLAGDWTKSKQIIDLDFADKASITAEEYPNDHKGRILLCTSHPEYMIWWDGVIEEVSPNGFHSLASGFHQWKNVQPLSENMQDEMMYTWWMIRRFVAWTAKIPDDHLPPMIKGDFTQEVKTLASELSSDGDIIKQMKNI